MASTKQVVNIQVASIVAAEVLVACLRLVAKVTIHTSYLISQMGSDVARLISKCLEIVSAPLCMVAVDHCLA